MGKRGPQDWGPTQIHYGHSDVAFVNLADSMQEYIKNSPLEFLLLQQRPSVAAPDTALSQNSHLEADALQLHLDSSWRSITGLMCDCPFLCFPAGQTPEELEDDSDFEQEDYDARSRTSVQTEDDQLIAGQSARVSAAHPKAETQSPSLTLSDAPVALGRTSGRCMDGWMDYSGLGIMFIKDLQILGVLL